jgi:hypothetical protein
MICLFSKFQRYCFYHFHAAQHWRNLPGDNDPKPGWQGIFAMPSRRRERRDSRVRFTRG